jgi:hypothetical protein
MHDASVEEMQVRIAAARAYAIAQRAEARHLESELAALNQRLGAARLRQEHMLRPSTFVTEAGRQRLERWLVRMHVRLHVRRPSP